MGVFESSPSAIVACVNIEGNKGVILPKNFNTLINLKDDKAKGVSFKDLENTDRPVRSILTLKPLLTIDPKDKWKGVLEEPQSAKKMTKSNFDAAQIARDEEIARQLELELFTHSLLNKDSFKDIQGLYMKEQKLIGDFVPIGYEEDKRMIRDMNKKAKEKSSDKGVDIKKKRKAGSWMKKMSKR
nr:hypothetical protein [Tanacetum cinerariifolium]